MSRPELSLVDWRTRVADLYAAVRAAPEPAEGHRLRREGRAELLDTAKGAWLGGDDSTLVLDLNFAYHPSCRYDDRWRCPLAPPGNTITARIEAGEQL